MSESKDNVKSVNLLKRLIKIYVAPYKGALLLAMCFMAVTALMTASIAQLMQPILDDVMTGRDTGLILPVASAFLGVFILRGVASYAGTIIMNRASQNIVGDVQKDIVRHVCGLDLSFFHVNPSAHLMSMVVNDANILRAALAESLMGVGRSLLTLIFLVGVMFYQDATLALAAMVVFPLAAGFVAYLGRRIRKISKSLQADVATLSDKLAKVFHGIRVVKAYGMESYEQARADAAITRVRDMNFKAVRVGALSTPVNEALVGLVLFGLIVYGGYQAANGAMSAGQLGAFLTAFIMAYEPMKRLAKLNNAIQAGLGAAERILAVMDTAPDIAEPSKAKILQSKKPDIVFDHIDFRYQGSDANALDGISFAAKPGQVTALVGPSGGGKSTVLNMIPRFYDAQDGQVSIGGANVKDLTLESLRGHIALVSQDITIFDDTIAANIAYGKQGAEQEDIEKAAKAAAAHDFIAALPNGYETEAGEDGVKLSGGQRQRIAIARAILRDAPILLLDEATSALDNESEKAIQKALKSLEKGRTTIVIAHRLSTVQNADQILVLDQGRIAEQGTHDALMKKNALYAGMYRAGFENAP